MKKILLIIFACVATGLSAVPTGTPQAAYIARYSKIAVDEMRRSGVPASITLAQGLLESDSGRSKLAVRGNNHFGIKCHDWKGRRIYFDDDRRHECFRRYSHPEASFKDHSDFLRYRDRYKFLFDLRPTDYKGWAYGLKKAGYATDPSYPQKLIRLIEEYDLTRFDTGRKISVKRERKRPADRWSMADRVQKETDDSRDMSVSKRLPEPPSVLEKSVPVKSGMYQEFKFSLTRQLYSQNKVPFVYSVDGETYASIAGNYGLFLGEILRYNDADKDVALMPGTRVYLQAKKNRAARHVEKHVVDEGETLREIAQRYGVKMKSLMKMNGLEEGNVLKDGDTVLLR